LYEDRTGNLWDNIAPLEFIQTLKDEKFEYPMWFESKNGKIVKFTGIKSGEVIIKSKILFDIGHFCTDLFPPIQIQAFGLK